MASLEQGVSQLPCQWPLTAAFFTGVVEEEHVHQYEAAGVRNHIEGLVENLVVQPRLFVAEVQGSVGEQLGIRQRMGITLVTEPGG